MEIIKSKEEMQKKALLWRIQGKTIGLVPTMGYLHEGHLALIKKAQQENDITIATIFVNPIQFGPNEDYATYPRDIVRDSELCMKNNLDCLFIPDKEEMYPPGFNTYINVEGLDKYLCGASRPGHFRGVATIVMKLFALCQPTRAYFGQKDIQQLTILKRMVCDLDLPLEIRMVPTLREADGLAISSRNIFLTAEERQQAPGIYRALTLAEKMIAAGQDDAISIIEKTEDYLKKEVSLGQIDYLQIVNAINLVPLQRIQKPLIIAVAIKMPHARLIDNIYLDD
ncbi:MAG: pantoate--beta-alanine ligase [Bacillota bacterium]|jgi:pantoate--beta-alanine ligase